MSFSSLAAVCVLIGATFISRVREKPFTGFEIVLGACALFGFLVATAFRQGVFQGVLS